MENSQKNYSLIKQIALFYVRSQPRSGLKKKNSQPNHLTTKKNTVFPGSLSIGRINLMPVYKSLLELD